MHEHRVAPEPPSPVKTLIAVEYFPPKLIRKLEELLKVTHERNGGYAKIHIDLVAGEVKRFDFTESYVGDAL